MDSFLKFIEEDIEAKKTLISTMPVKTKGDIKKFNSRIETIESKYSLYKENVKKYIETKSKSFAIKKESNNIETLEKNVKKYDEIKDVLNPLNSYFEKLGFDSLVYLIRNYSDFNFKSLNDIINQFLDKFEMVGIKLSDSEFNYTCYVNEYMTSFLDVRKSKKPDYDKVSQVFEQIYWVNPEIIQHIELNFRRLIKKYKKNFESYILKLKKQIMEDNNIKSYEECLPLVNDAYRELEKAKKENIVDILDLSKSATIDINSYFPENKTRISTFDGFMINPVDKNDKSIMDKFYENMERLKLNVIEYMNYSKFLPLIEDFKDNYKSLIPTSTKNSSLGKELKNIETEINTKESKLDALNKKIIPSKLSIFGKKNENSIKLLKIESIKLSKDLYELYKKYDNEYFKEKVISVLNGSMTVPELLNLYYSFEYFKKEAIKRVYAITSYDEILKYHEEFNLFAKNPNNIVITGISIFEDSSISKVIMNKYRLYNINLDEDILNPDNLSVLLDKINLVLRVNIIENSETTIEKIWFMTQVEKFNKKEEKK